MHAAWSTSLMAVVQAELSFWRTSSAISENGGLERLLFILSEREVYGIVLGNHSAVIYMYAK